MKNKFKSSRTLILAKVFVLALSRPRDEYKYMLESVGTKLVSAVGSKTDLLVCNESSSSSKYKRCAKIIM